MPNPHAVRKTITVEHALKILNRMLEEDPVATRNLVLTHIQCNEDLSKDPTIQTRSYNIPNEEPAYSVGIMGVLNGLFGVDEGGWGPICVDVKLACTVGCELPDGIMLVVNKPCPLCIKKKRKGDKRGEIVFGSVEGFYKTPSPDERREGPASG